MRYKPWKLRQDNAWEDEQPSEQLYINKWHEFLQTPYAKANVPEWFEKLQAVVESQEETCNGHVDVASASTREEWMILADLHTPFKSSDEQTHSKHDWRKIDVITLISKLVKCQHGSLETQTTMMEHLHTIHTIFTLLFSVITTIAGVNFNSTISAVTQKLILSPSVTPSCQPLTKS